MSGGPFFVVSLKMFTYRVMWNDAPKCRDVELRISYTIRDEKVLVLEILPTMVFVYEVEGESVFKELPVHTETGRRLLARAYLAGRDALGTLEDEILAYHASTDDRLAV